MEALNRSLFLLINASSHPNHVLVHAANFLAERLIWAVPVLLAGLWLWGGVDSRRAVVTGTTAAGLGLLIAQVAALIWPHPRPVVTGLGHILLRHAADPSFPSDHLTLIWSVSFVMLCYRPTRFAGFLASLAGLPVAWARIYLGVHFPLDIIGAALVAVASAYLCTRLLAHPLGRILSATQALHEIVFRGPIRRGWVAG